MPQGFTLTIEGVDVNPAALERARNARYSAWSLRETDEELRRRWFRAEGRDHALESSLKQGVSFHERNLIERQDWAPESFDVVFCRNVLMYFSAENAKRAVRQLARALAPGGYLFLGHAETLRGVSHDFHLRHTHDTFYYERKERLAETLEQSAPTVPELSFEPARAPGWAQAWLDTIQQASDRIAALTERGRAETPARPRELGATGTLNGSSPKPPSSGADLSPALRLLEAERFGEALGALRDQADAETNVDALLLRAVLLAQSGQLPEAEGACQRLLEADEYSAGAHYLLALCRERGGDARGAVDHSQIAAYLDRSFAMPRLHLGLLARRAGDRVTAARELQLAAGLLESEDPARLLLFGGGFKREGLIALCRSELGRLEGAR